MKKILSIVLVLLVMSVSITPVFADQTADKESLDLTYAVLKVTGYGFEVVAENNDFSLYFNKETAAFAVLVKSSGKMWYSNPQLTREQTSERSSGNDKIKSQICITLLDQTRNPGNSINSYSASVRDGNFKVEEYIEDGKKTGIIITYDFTKEVHMFRIPLAVFLTQTGLKVEVLFDKVEEYGTSKLCNVEVLPMFGAAFPEEEGYLFIPDGSGAIVDFSGMQNNFSDYSSTVYGADPSVNLKDRSVSDTSGIKMPVFGAKVGDNAFFAIIKGGDGYATINASSSMSRFKLATVWSSFPYREFDETGLISQDSVSRTIRMCDEAFSSANPVIEYAFLSNEQANYSGMAKYYREYLVEKYSLKKVTADKVDPFLQFFGLTYSSETIFGIPVKRALAATTLAQVQEFTEGLKENGVDQSTVFLYGFQKGGFENKILSEFKVDNKVGGKKALKSLVQSVGNGNVFMAFDITRDYSFGGLFKGNRYISSMNNVAITKQYGLLSTGAWNGTKLDEWRYLTNAALQKFGKKFVNSIDADLGCGIIFQNLGTELYNDFNTKTHADRQQFMDTYSQLHKAASDKGIKVGSDGANIYMLETAAVLSEVPTKSSAIPLFTASVPFYSMVVHGYAKISSLPVNYSENRTELINECAAYGVMPTYRLTAMESNKLKNSNLKILFNTGMSDWKDVIPADYAYINSVCSGLCDQVIVSHRYEGNLSITEYENGVVLVYNQSNTETATFSGKEIDPLTTVRI